MVGELPGGAATIADPDGILNGTNVAGRLDLAALAATEGQPLDVLVVGGGIYGAWTAYDAALRGLRVALVERRDFGSATSQASSKLIHGGLRYLEHLEFGLVRKALHERRTLTRLAAHRVHGLRLVLPFHDRSMLHRLKVRAGLWLYDLLAGRGQPVGRHESLRSDVAAARYPFLTRPRMTGALTFWDCRTDDARLTLDVVLAARRAGAITVNHTDVERLLFDANGAVRGAQIRSTSGTKPVDVFAKVVINTSGPFLDHLCPRSDGRDTLRLTKGVHLVLPKLPTQDGVLSVGSDGRVLFILPWYQRTLVGTTDTDYQGDPAAVTVDRDDVSYLLAAANQILDVDWTPDDVLASYAGVRALQNTPAGSPTTSPGSVSRDWDVEIRRPGLLCSVGGKLTTARVEAARLIDAACVQAGRPELGSLRPTDDTPLPMAPKDADFKALCGQVVAATRELSLSPELAVTIAERYGTGYKTILDLIREDPTLGQPLHAGLPFCRAEIVHAARSEMALTLEDVLRRRVPILILDRVPRDVLSLAADLVGSELGWSEEQKKREVADVAIGHKATSQSWNPAGASA